MLNLIPMAGRGNRFTSEKHRVPKPMLPVMGQPMVVTACRSFPKPDRWMFLCDRDHLKRFPIQKLLEGEFPPATIVPIQTPTEGPACTCLLAMDQIDPAESVLVASCDYQTVYDTADYAQRVADPSIDVLIWTFKGKNIVKKDPRAFAYCRTEGQRVTSVVEKQLISDHPAEDPAVVGSFFFRRADLLKRASDKMIQKNIRIHNEFYVGTAINQLIDEGCRVETFEIQQFVSFGDPLELTLFEFWEDYFNGLEGHPYKSRFGISAQAPWSGKGL